MAALTVAPRSPALRPFIRSLHLQETRIPAAYERMLPTGHVHLLVNAYEDEFRTYAAPGRISARTHGAVLAGARSQPVIIDTREQWSLIRVDFHLGGAAAFFSLPLVEVCEQFVELDNLWQRDGVLLRERLLDARTPREKLQTLEEILLARLARSHPTDPALIQAARRMESGLAVSQIGSQLGVLPKTLVRRFHQYVGLAPKRYARVRRLQRLLAVINSGRPFEWAQLAAAHGYTDQAHFIHDFRDLTGVSPSAYRPSAAGVQNHIPLEIPG